MEEEKSSSTDQLVAAISSVLGDGVSRLAVERGDVIAHVSPEKLLEVLTKSKESPQLDFALLVDITAVDWMDSRTERFEVVYQLLSLSKQRRLTLSVVVAEQKPQVPSAAGLWAGANFLEREVWDMFGIVFSGHPDLRRILMYEEFVGHPLRKDYPVQGKQPRVPLRSPEVENTARKMRRGDLVTIRSRSTRAEGRAEG
jgi:NADH-quinone oxidoreductase subunit C